SGLRPIETIEPGDEVLSRDEITGEWTTQRVLETFDRLHCGEVVTIELARETIRATDEHPFWVLRGEDLADRTIVIDGIHSQVVPGGWVSASQLRAGDVLCTREGSEATIQSVRVETADIPVYYLHVDATHTYTVGSSAVW